MKVCSQIFFFAYAWLASIVLLCDVHAVESDLPKGEDPSLDSFYELLDVSLFLFSGFVLAFDVLTDFNQPVRLGVSSFETNLANHLNSNAAYDFDENVFLVLPATIFYGGQWAVGDKSDGVRLLAFTEGLFLEKATASTSKMIFDRERPSGEDDRAFISGHTSDAFYIANFLYFDLSVRCSLIEAPAAKYSLLAGLNLLASAVAYSRLKSGSHYLFDVIAGGAVGVGTAIGMSHRYLSANRKNMALDGIGPWVNRDALGIHIQF